MAAKLGLAPRIVVNNGDYLDTQLYLYDPNKQVTELTSGSGWKSGGAKISAGGGDLAYISADNQNYPYPLTVVIQPLF